MAASKIQASAHILFSSFMPYGVVTYLMQPRPSWPGHTTSYPSMKTHRYLTSQGEITAPDYAWAMQLKLEDTDGERLADLFNNLMEAGVLQPGSYTPVQYAKQTVFTHQVLDLEKHLLNKGDVILSDYNSESKTIRVERKGERQIDDKSKYAASFYISYVTCSRVAPELYRTLDAWKASKS